VLCVGHVLSVKMGDGLRKLRMLFAHALLLLSEHSLHVYRNELPRLYVQPPLPVFVPCTSPSCVPGQAINNQCLKGVPCRFLCTSSSKLACGGREGNRLCAHTLPFTWPTSCLHCVRVCGCLQNENRDLGATPTSENKTRNPQAAGTGLLKQWRVVLNGRWGMGDKFLQRPH
jgi:hypothetical protein